MENQRSSLLGQPLHRKRLASVDENHFFKDHVETESIYKSYQELFMENWRSGLTVGLVNLPLCIALSVASGSTPSAGILSGIIGGIVTGFLGGSNYNIVGPTGALSGFLASCVFRYGVHSLPYFAIVAGGLTLLARKYGLAKYIDLFPVTVNEGFTLGVASIIMLNQLNPALGIGKFKEVVNIQVNSTTIEEITKTISTEHEDSLIHNVANNLRHINQMNIQAFILFLIIFAALFYLIKNYPLIPWHAAAAAFGILIGSSGYFTVETLFSKFGEIKLDLYDFSYFKIPPSFLLAPTVWVDAMPIAFIAILETLISAKIADGLTHTTFNKPNELRGLGVSNLVSGFLGGLPITAALARTTLNIRSGATDKISSLLNGVVLFLIAFICIPFFKFLPVCVAAAQVSMVAVRMINFAEISVLYYKDRTNFMILILTASICILMDPTIGIIFGMLIYLINFSENLTTPWTEIIGTLDSHKKPDEKSGKTLFDGTDSGEGEQQHHKGGHKGTSENFVAENLDLFISDLPKAEGEFILYRIVGIVNFMNVIEHVEKLRKFAMTDGVTVVISLRYLHFIDIEAMHAIRHLIDAVAKERRDSKVIVHNKIIITGLSKKNMNIFQQDKEWVQELHKNNMLFFKDGMQKEFFD